MSLSPAVSLLRDLIRCPSVTPNEGGALALLARVLGAAGFETHRVVFSEPGQPDVDNLYARIGTEAPCLVFAGHTDVVPPGDVARWRFDPFSGEIADGMIWGRGACDMKGGVAACVAAALDYVGRHGTPKGSIAFLITGDEEGPAVNGTVKLLDWALARGERFDHCLLGEPTNPNALGDMMKIGRRGSLTGRVTAKGVQGHVAYPHLADNPIPRLVAILTALKATPLDAGTAHFDASNLEVTSVDVGNPASNVIPAEARATFNIRFNDLWTPQTLADEIARRCAGAADPAGFALAFEPTNALAFLTRPGRFSQLVGKAIEAETGRTPKLSTTGGTSDARFIVKACEVIEFGLVGQTMHMVDERVAVADVDRLAGIYARVIADYFA
ncbi:MAG: succinyl-diaminopimelate desuccinylase [Rhizobiales bacterium]|nr:succinyl-diaminopimelate desuccinylase [Hyphomicrobiales bacterium]